MIDATKIEAILEKRGYNNSDLVNEIKQLFEEEKQTLLFKYEKHRTLHVIGANDEWRKANVNHYLALNK